MRTLVNEIAFSALAVIATLTVSLPAAAQGNGMNSNGFNSAIHGVPPSVTSFGFGGHPGFHGVPASVTSLGFGSSPFRINQGPFFFHHHHRNPGFVNPFFGDIVAVPYAYPVYVMEPGGDDSMEEDYRGGPTIFDRRGPGTREYVRAERRNGEDYPRATASSESAKQPEVADQPRTVLVFKDGHQTEILNYAIVGATLYDLSEGRARRIALAELDLPATVKHNDDRGVDFQLPARAKLD